MKNAGMENVGLELQGEKMQDWNYVEDNKPTWNANRTILIGVLQN